MNLDQIISDFDKPVTPSAAPSGTVAARQQSCKVGDLDPSLLGKVGKSQAPPCRMSVSNLMELDKADQSLQRYKQNLLGAIGQIVDDRETEVQFIACELVAEGHPWGPLKIVPGSKENKLTLKEGCKYHLRLTFLVRYDIVVCLKMVNNVWRGPLKVATQEEMIGSFAPLATQHVVNLEDERAPEGFLGRGDYNGKVVILDKEGTVHLQYQYQLHVSSHW